jgi:hypothetical protein
MMCSCFSWLILWYISEIHVEESVPDTYKHKLGQVLIVHRFTGNVAGKSPMTVLMGQSGTITDG